MVEEKNESSRNLLAEIEGDWDSPKPPAVTRGTSGTTGTPGTPTERKLHAELDAAADRLIDSLEPPPVSVPTSVDDLDSGWGEEGADDEEEEEDEEEPELPDERLDPVAYAAAKKARDERIEARRQRRRVKADAKKARRRARADAARGKQKAKTRRAPTPEAKAKAKADAKSKARAEAAARRATKSGGDDDASAAHDDGDDGDQELAVASRASAKGARGASKGGRSGAGPNPSRVMGSKAMLSKTNQWMLAVAVLVFVAAAVFAAVIAR